MKLLAILSAKKLITLSVIGVLSLATVGGFMLNHGNEEPQTAQPSVKFDREVKESPTAEIVEVEKVEEVNEAPIVANEEVKAPKVPIAEEVSNETSILNIEQPPTLLSYAKTQLDLSTPELENCFNMIVQEYSERFNGSEAHRNVRALRGYANVCTSGITSKNQGNIYMWDIGKGYKGAYFDSDIANASL